MASGLPEIRDRQEAHGLSDLGHPDGRPRRRAGDLRHLVGRCHRGGRLPGLHRMAILADATRRRSHGLVRTRKRPVHLFRAVVPQLGHRPLRSNAAVEINAGPFERHWGVASVELVTAAMATNASIDGLPAEEAKALRERITEMAEEKDAAL